MDRGALEEVAMDRAIAESHLHQEKEALKDLDGSARGEPDDPGEAAARDLAIAEVSLGAGLAQRAEEAAAKAAAQFKSAGLLDSELRSACIGASAARMTRDSAAAAGFSAEVVDIGAKIQQTWTPQASQTYFSRPDIQGLMRENRLARLPDRR